MAFSSPPNASSSSKAEQEPLNLNRECTHVVEHADLAECGASPHKTIDYFGSLCLVANNISGPAMMGIPAVMCQAGILPTTFAIILVWVLSSLSGTMLSETIQKLPNNKSFDRNVDFSYAFACVVGKQWHGAVESLVILSCLVNACAGLVETAQGLDSFLASYVFGKVWAVTVPGFSLVEWDSGVCQGSSSGHHESKTKTCIPFHNVHESVFSLGYLLCFLAFYPLGRNDLKETMIVQKISFALFFMLILFFLWEFEERGFEYMDRVPWLGSNWSQLCGVILFNYAYPITIPSWLTEKKHSVPVNSIIWTSSAIATVVYIVFSVCAAASFNSPGSDMLVVLASNKASAACRLAAASFGVAIIGSGVPVFCVIVRRQLAHSGLMSENWAVFFGTLFPYLTSWYVYQGKGLLEVLNWTGLFVNGLIAFILPLVLALAAYRTGYGSLSQDSHGQDFEHSHNHGHGHSHAVSASPKTLSPPPSTGDVEMASIGGASTAPLLADANYKHKYQSIPSVPTSASSGSRADSGASLLPHSHSHGHSHSHDSTLASDWDDDDDQDHPADGSSEVIKPLYDWLEPFRGAILSFGTITFVAMIVFTVVLDIKSGGPPS